MAELDKEDIILKNKIAERIQVLRTKTGLSHSEFAKKHEIDRQILNKFCKMINISLQDFFDF